MKTADEFFNDVDYTSIVDTIKGIFTSDGSMSTLLDFERVLDEADLYAFKNWELGELVQGPMVNRYDVACMFMYPHKLMPDPRGARRLLKLGCTVQFKKTKLKVPIEIDTPEDFMPGTRYPKSVMKPIWLINIIMPKDLMDDIREGSVDLAGQDIDLHELDDSYDEDLDKEDTTEEQETEQAQQMPGMTAPAPQGAAQQPAL